MKAIAALILALSVGATAVADPVRGADGILRYHAGGPAPVLRCPVNMLCDIALVPTDSVSQNVPPVAGDMDDFDIKATPGFDAHVFIVSLKAGIRTNLAVVATTLTGATRTYHFFIISTSNAGSTSSVNIAFFPTHEKLSAPPVVMLAPAATPTPDPLGDIDLRALDCAPSHFSVSGDASFRPIRVCVDAVRTYIQINEVPEIPALLGADNHWTSRAINFGYHDGFFIVPAHYDRFILVLGDGKSQQRVTIERH